MLVFRTSEPGSVPGEMAGPSPTGGAVASGNSTINFTPSCPAVGEMPRRLVFWNLARKRSSNPPGACLAVAVAARKFLLAAGLAFDQPFGWSLVPCGASILIPAWLALAVGVMRAPVAAGLADNQTSHDFLPAEGRQSQSHHSKSTPSRLPFVEQRYDISVTSLKAYTGEFAIRGTQLRQFGDIFAPSPPGAAKTRGSVGTGTPLSSCGRSARPGGACPYRTPQPGIP